ncbi:MAG: putative signal transducing protein [Deferrisomatales bacterium]
MFTDVEEVYVALDPVEASAVEGLLAGAGFDVRLRNMAITPYPVSFGPLGEKRVAVPSAEAERAREVLREAVADGFLRPQGIILDPPRP